VEPSEHSRWVREPVALLLVGLAVGLAGCSRASRVVEAQPAQQSTQQSGQPSSPEAAENDPANLHSISVKFDYDFQKSPPCSEKPALKTCIKQFDVYDVSGARFRLFSIPVPKDATGMVKGIAGQSPSRIFLPGTHFIAVTAESTTGVESDVSLAKVQVEVRPKNAGELSSPTK